VVPLVVAVPAWYVPSRSQRRLDVRGGDPTFVEPLSRVRQDPVLAGPDGPRHSVEQVLPRQLGCLHGHHPVPSVQMLTTNKAKDKGQCP